MMDNLENMTDEQVFVLESEITAEAMKRRALADFRLQARIMAEKARDMGASQQRVETIIDGVVAEVYTPEPAEVPVDVEPEPDAEA